MRPRGWYIMHRGWMQSDDFAPAPYTEREAFLWSIESAAYLAHDQWFNRELIPVERGEFVTSIREMARVFEWSEKSVRTFIAKMCRVGKWSQRRAQPRAKAPTVIIVCNYDFYQSSGARQGAAEGTELGTPKAHEGHSAGTQQKEGQQGKTRFNDSEHGSSGNPCRFPPNQVQRFGSGGAPLRRI